jgi:hypothetical protein
MYKLHEHNEKYLLLKLVKATVFWFATETEKYRLKSKLGLKVLILQRKEKNNTIVFFII